MQPLQVRDLPSSASFYAAIVQPLKLRYISANSSSIVFGDSISGSPVLEVKRLSPGQHLRPSRVVLSAQSPSVVSAFRAAALRAEPETPIETFDDGRIEVTDFDGNIIEVVCPAGYRSNFTRANSSASMSASREPRTMIKRSATTPAEPSSRESAGGFGAGTGMGTVLGAAAVGVAVGSALTYAFMSNGRQRSAPRQEYEAGLPRRASYSDPQPNVQPRYIEDKKYPPLSYGARYAQIEAPRSRVVEDLDDRASRHGSHYTTTSRSRRLSEASTRRPPTVADVEYMSTAPSKYEQKLLMDREYRSQVGGEDDRRSRAPSKYSAAPSRHTATPSKYAAESEYRGRSSSKSRAPRMSEAETYVSSRSKRPASVARPPTRSHSRVSARELDLPESRTGWDDDDDIESIAPEDSISCVGDEGYQRRPVQRHAPFGTPSMVGRFRRVVNEFDGKRRPLYGSEVK
ncbi:hypothetical protein F5Y11DRAFT_319369 [Daldinia sp. FL1419]|nr:hypothetical protein F5Y11DRAFT_319369 [Daldinia sp. FL1419]